MAGELLALFEAVEHIIDDGPYGPSHGEERARERLQDAAAAVREAMEREIDGAVMLELFAANTDLQGFARAVERRVKAELMGGKK